MSGIPVLFLSKITKILPCSSNLNPSQQSSSLGDLRPKMMESETPPLAAPSYEAGDPEVLSRRTFPGQGEVQEVVKAAPETAPAALCPQGDQLSNEP